MNANEARKITDKNAEEISRARKIKALTTIGSIMNAIAEKAEVGKDALNVPLNESKEVMEIIIKKLEEEGYIVSTTSGISAKEDKYVLNVRW